jgi:YgiT-type zinc finger domain-containing protein
VEGRFENKEGFAMKCGVCGSKMTSLITDLPFKLSETTIVIVKGLPIFQCDNCSQFLLDDSVIDRVETILAKVDTAAELEVISYAA